MKLSSAVLLGTAYGQLDLNDLERKNERSVASAVGSLSTSSANKLAQEQVGSSFPHANDILFTQSQAAEFASLGVPIAAHHVSSAPAWKEQIDANARGVSNGIMNGRLWQQHVNPANCDVKTDANCRYMVPYFYADGTTTAVRANIETAMANIEAKTCLQFQYLSNPRSFTYVNKKKLRVVTNLNLCSSYVGANLIEQDIYLSHHSAMDCGLNTRAVEHEILHAVGLYHENQRYDWEDFIEYNWANIDVTKSAAQINSDYGVIPEEMSNTFGSMYDTKSIMHLLSETNLEGGPPGAPCTLATCVLMAHDNESSRAYTAINADFVGEPDDTRGFRTGSLTDEDAWQINNMYGCTAYLEKYMFTCSPDASTAALAGGRATGFSAHVMSHQGGSDGVCDAAGNNISICPAYNNGTPNQPDTLDEDTTATCGKCSRGNHNCAANANCVNDVNDPVNNPTTCNCEVQDLDWTDRVGLAPGSWGAASAQPNTSALMGNGFSLISGGTGCADVNECIDTQTCYDQNADVRLQCINFDGGYECVCPPGQTHPPENASNPLQHLTRCVDLDECATEQHGCPAHMECINRICEAGFRNSNGDAASNNADDVGYGDPCHYGETNILKSYECGCKQQDGQPATTGTYGTCENVNQCAGTSYTDGSNVFGTEVCEMCDNGQMSSDCPASLGKYDAGLMCFDKDDATNANGFECRCPLGAEMQYYTAAFFAELDEANDNQVNGDMIAIANTLSVMPMTGWLLVDYSIESGTGGTPGTHGFAITDLSAFDFDAAADNQDPPPTGPTKRENGDVRILIPRSYHKQDASSLVVQTVLNNGDEGLYYITVTWDNTTKTWTSEHPAQCVDIDMCPRTKCPGRTAFNVECTENSAYPQNQTDGSGNVLFSGTTDGSGVGGLVGDATFDANLSAQEHIEQFFARQSAVQLAAGQLQFYSGAMEGLPTCLAGECVFDPKEEYDSLTNQCVDVNECDRWLIPNGSDKDLYTLYEEAVRSGTVGTTWADIITNPVTIYDKNNILQNANMSPAPGTNEFIIARGAPNANLCGLAGAKLPAIGTAPFDTTLGADSYNLKCVNKSATDSTHGFECVCPEGSRAVISGTKTTCEDIHECENGTHQCGMQPCIDYCRHGKIATWDADYQTCTDVNGVVADGGYIGGGYDCQCPPGYEYDFNLLRCVDVDECTNPEYLTDYGDGLQNICERNRGSVCVNVPGDFYCTCAVGQFDEDVFSQFGDAINGYVNPAQCTPQTCSKPAAVHDNSVYCANNSCDCSTGSQCQNRCDANGDGEVDANMIVGYNCHECLPLAVCTDNNTSGYTCSCPINSAQDGLTACNDGNQCGPGKAGTADCSVKGLTCKEEDVGYSCVCDNETGFELVVNAQTGLEECNDIDECVNNPAICVQGNCVNEEGTYSCTCFAGYDLVVPGRSLVAIPADAQSGLKTSQGGRSPAGIVSDNWQVFAVNQVASQSRTGGRSAQFECRDENECDTGNNHCVDPAFGGTCTNLEGSYSCGCQAGYSGDGADSNKYNAINGAASGFIAPIFQSVDPSTFLGCVDIDECLNNNGNCHVDAICANVSGTFQCLCPPDKPLGDGVAGCFADPDDVVTTASPISTEATTTAMPVGNGGTVANDFNCAGQGMLSQVANIASDVAVSCFGSSCGVQCVDPSKSPNVSGLFCQNTGKAKKQGWKNGNKKLSAGTPISCGAATGGSNGGSNGSSGGFCGMSEAALNAAYGPNVNFSKCKAGASKCKVSCKNGRKPSPKKLKCKGGRITASSIRC